MINIAAAGVMLMAFLAVFGCNKEKNEVKMKSGLIIVDNVVGEGLEAEKFDILTVNYTGKLEDGTVFDSSKNPGRDPFRFTVGTGQVIQGWEEGFIGMKIGGTRMLTIPPEMGYGVRGAGDVIPPNATLIFEIELLEVEKN
ncbi:MAG: FKBP-type peptidyl-prolyl cis-trans isomerase [Candidatus Marinimicrobia bacterium]|nr:FKBP-type peptidyl-prolyl cis-trans isomerase [Candidatus Neomarinimicrobiota bacterium]